MMTAQQLVDRNHKQYDFKYFGSVSIPAVGAGGAAQLSISVSSDAHFRCRYITASYTTLDVGGADGGANGITMQLVDQGRSLTLFDDQISAELFSSPGRQRSSGVAGDPSNQLFYPIDFDYMFLANSTIFCDLRNTLATANTFNICFHGSKYRVDFNQPPIQT